MPTRPASNLWTSNVVLAGGLIGLLASLNPAWQISLLGLSSMAVGVVVFLAAMVYAVLSLVGFGFSRLFNQLLLVTVFTGLVVAHWLYFDSLYISQVLQPWSLTVVLAVTMIYAGIEHRLVIDGSLGLPKDIALAARQLYEKNLNVGITIAWLALLAGLAFVKFGSNS